MLKTPPSMTQYSSLHPPGRHLTSPFESNGSAFQWNSCERGGRQAMASLYSSEELSSSVFNVILDFIVPSIYIPQQFPYDRGIKQTLSSIY